MKINDYLSKEEVATFTRKSDVHGFALLGWNWLLIAAIFFVAAKWSNPVVLVLAIVLLGSRQLGLGILMHEAGHRSLFASERYNRFFGQWLCAYPILADVHVYARSHKEHHRLAGSEQDPDISNYQSYPVSTQSFRRKLFRDITGQTGIKLLAGIIRGRGDLMVRGDAQANQLRGALLINALLLLVLALSGQAALYLLWMIAFLTTYPMVARIRQIAEHGAVNDLYNPDPRKHTRTTLANSLERLLFCPNFVNYHAEHHFIASVPCFRLPKLHRLLRRRGFYDKHPMALAQGYSEVLNRAIYF